MTITTPWRRMTLQLSQRVLTDAETFMSSLFQIVCYLSRYLMWARTRCLFSSSMANIAFGSGSMTVPSTSIASFLATGGGYLPVLITVVNRFARRSGRSPSAERRNVHGRGPTHDREVYQKHSDSIKDRHLPATGPAAPSPAVRRPARPVGLTTRRNPRSAGPRPLRRSRHQ